MASQDMPRARGEGNATTKALVPGMLIAAGSSLGLGAAATSSSTFVPVASSSSGRFHGSRVQGRLAADVPLPAKLAKEASGAQSSRSWPSQAAAPSLGLGLALGLGASKRAARGNASGAFARNASLLAGATAAGTQRRRRNLAVACRAMFERFTAESMKAIMLAQAEARKLGQYDVSPVTLILGVLAEDSDLGARTLHSLGIDIEDARMVLQEILGTKEVAKALEIPFTPVAKAVLESAVEMAQTESSAQVHTGHILLAVTQPKFLDDQAGKFLGSMLSCEDADEIQARVAEAMSMLSGSDAQQAQPAGGAATAQLPDASQLDLTETLNYAEDLTALAQEGKLEPLIGRDAQLERTIRILGRRSKNNPVFVGEAGVGKTAIAHGLAERIARGKVPPTLMGKRVLQLDLALLLAGTRYRGDFEERLRAVVKEVTDSNRQVILVIDEIHTLVGAGSGGGDGGGMDAANLLKPALARGELQCMGATTLDEYRQYIEKDPALERRFQQVTVPEPTEDEAEQILTGLAPKYERHHQLKYTPEALKASVKLAAQYISDRYLPDKAIDVMDEAGSKVRQQIFNQVAGAERKKLDQDKAELRRRIKEAVAAEMYEEAHSLKQQEVAVDAQLEALTKGEGPNGMRSQLLEEMFAVKAQVQDAVKEERYEEAQQLKEREQEILARLPAGVEGIEELANAQVTETDVAQVVAGWTGIAVEQVSASESARLMKLEELLHESVIGQDVAVQAVSRALRRARAGLRNPSRPIASFIFSGPTGVGKTQLCKTLASTFFGAEDSMVRLDMSEFMEKHTVSKLIGAPPGYVGYSEGGALTEAVRRKPYSLVLFDEVEKAHPDVFNMMLQLLDDGRLTDSKGRTVSFANTLIVLTSNIGSRAVQKGAAGGASLGFGTVEDESEASYDTVKELVHEEMKSFFRPEFLNRLDETIVFKPLTKDDVRKIADVEFRFVLKRLVEQNLDVILTDKFKEFVVEKGFDPAYGARPLRRAISEHLEDRLAEYLLNAMANDLVEGEEAQEVERKSVVVDIAADGSVEVRSPESRESKVPVVA